MSVKKIVLVKVSDEERKEIERIFERLQSLKDLMLMFADKKDIFDEKNYLYEKIINDLTSTKNQFRNWWSETVNKYKLEEYKQERLSVDFSNNEIYFYK